MAGRPGLTRLDVIVGVVALSPSVTLSVLVFTFPLWVQGEVTWNEAVIIGSIGIVSVLSATATLWSIRHGKRWAWVGLALGAAFLLAVGLTPVAVGVAHYYFGIGIIYMLMAATSLLESRNPKRTR